MLDVRRFQMDWERLPERIEAVVVAAADVVTLEGATCWVTPAAVDAGPAVELEPCEAAAPPVGRER